MLPKSIIDQMLSVPSSDVTTVEKAGIILTHKRHYYGPMKLLLPTKGVKGHINIRPDKIDSVEYNEYIPNNTFILFQDTPDVLWNDNLRHDKDGIYGVVVGRVTISS